MHLRRPLQKLDHRLRGDGWGAARGAAVRLTELNGSALGILGVGTIGRRIAAIARDGFGMQLLGTSRRRGSLPPGIEEVALAELFARSDAVVVCCALTEETRGMVNRDLLGRMPSHAVLVNVSRGAVIELATPHTAGITATSSRAMAVGSAEEMLRILRGQAPLNLVNPACKAQ
jgi:D-3-phosphoglycerate dehydrogenase